VATQLGEVALPRKSTSRSNEPVIGRALSRAEVLENAASFAEKWEGKEGIKPHKEESHKQSFWRELFAVYGLPVGAVATFEFSIGNVRGNTSSIDLFYPKVCIVEHKSRGCTEAGFAKALAQAVEYVQDLTRAGQTASLPPYLIVSDFARIRVYDLRSGADKPVADFHTADLAKNADALDFLRSGLSATGGTAAEASADFKAVQLLCDLHDALEDGGYSGHQLEVFLVRVLFCLFADDTEMFERGTFHDIVRSSREDAADLGALLAQTFNVLDTPITNGRRTQQPPALFASLPYVNGALFQEDLGFATFTRQMRDALIRCCEFGWQDISPHIFGSLFQSAMEARERRSIGAHYTNERDILKVIRPLFLNDLEHELAECGSRSAALRSFHEKLASLKFLDPACGCGNFLVVAYRELRRLEHECLTRLQALASKSSLEKHGKSIDPSLLKVSISQFYGIELDEWAARIAEVALVLTERQEDLRLLNAFTYSRLPLKHGGHIRIGNALRIDWNEVLPASDCSFIMGNPPFVGSKWQSDTQREDMAVCAEGVKNYGLLDYVAGWYLKATDYTRLSDIRCSFVSTNSISQGEQVGVLWDEMFKRGARIHFAHRTFEWQSDARGEAHVHVVVVGFGMKDRSGKVIFDYPDGSDDPTSVSVRNISPYLVEGADFAITSRSTPLCNVPPMVSGNQPIDDGQYLFTPEERLEFISQEPKSAPYFKRWLGGDEFINGIERWYLHLVDCPPTELRSMPLVQERIAAVRRFRSASRRASTVKLAETPTRFQVEFSPTAAFLALPQVSSERREYIPMAYLTPEFLPGDKLRCIANATLFHFGVLTSLMQMSWTRLVTGRLKSDYQYSVKLVYNNFPFPQSVSDSQREAVETAAQGVLDARAMHPTATLADLYDPLTMPPNLRKAHDVLDKAVDRCYRATPFKSERERVEFLFAMHQSLSAPLTAKTEKRGRARKAKPKGNPTILE
jgi:hypothetical protein